MPKAKGKSLKSPMKPPFPTPHPGGELGTGLDFASEPTEAISGHNVYQGPEGTYDGQKKGSGIVTPAKKVTRVKVDE